MSDLESQLQNTLLPQVLINFILKYMEPIIKVKFANKSI
jgi:hypothetical protein